MKLRTTLTVFVLLLALRASAVVAAEDTEDVIKIPLDTIWAHAMPGTRDIGELEKGAAKQGGKFVDQVGGALRFLPKGKTTGKGFTVSGTEKEALKNAYTVLVENNSHARNFQVALISGWFSTRIHLDSTSI